MKSRFAQTMNLALVSHTLETVYRRLLGVHLPRSQFKIRSAVELKRVGFSFTRSCKMVVMSDELLSVSDAGPLSSMDASMDWAVSETAEKGTILSLSRTSMRWHAARETEMEVTAREALCQAKIQYGRSDAWHADCWKAALNQC